MCNRGDVYNRMNMDDRQFVVIGLVTGFLKDRNVFYTRTEVGTAVTLPAVCHRRAVNATNGCPDVLSADTVSPPSKEIVKGTAIHAICRPSDQISQNPFAVRWCLQTEFELCEQKIKEVQERIEAKRAWCEEVERRAAELVRQDAERREAELTANPRNYDEAISRGWTVVEGKGNGSQRVLENKQLFPDSLEAKRHRITKHLERPTVATKRSAVSRFAMT